MIGALLAVDVLGSAYDAMFQLLGLWSEFMHLLAEWFDVTIIEYGFMHRAFLVGILIAVMAPLIGTFLVHRQLALIGDTLAHTAIAGVAVGLFVNAVFGTGVSSYLTASSSP